MGKKHKHLFERIIDPVNIRRAYAKASAGKTQSHGHLAFREEAEARLLWLEQHLANGTWTAHPYRQFYVWEPKRRLISAPTFSDRVVHHAVVQVIEPIFDATFLPTSFACRTGKGTHAGVAWVQAQLRRHGYTQYLKTDFRSFFPSVDRVILHEQYAKKVSDQRTLDLLARIIPPTGTGIPIGALTSQLSANIYGNPLDHFLHHELRVPFARYMDDIVVLGHDRRQMRSVKEAIETFAADQMRLSISRWTAQSTDRGIDWLGYRVWATHKLLRKASVTRAKRKIRRYTADGDTESLTRFIGSWRGHASFGDTINLRVWLDEQHHIADQLAAHRATKRPTRDQLLQDLFEH